MFSSKPYFVLAARVTHYIRKPRMVETDSIEEVREAVTGAAARFRELSDIADKSLNHQKSAQ